MAPSAFCRTDTSEYCGCRRSCIRSGMSLGAGRRSSHRSNPRELDLATPGLKFSHRPSNRSCGLLARLRMTPRACDPLRSDARAALTGWASLAPWPAARLPQPSGTPPYPPSCACLHALTETAHDRTAPPQPPSQARGSRDSPRSIRVHGAAAASCVEAARPLKGTRTDRVDHRSRQTSRAGRMQRRCCARSFALSGGPA